MVYFKDVLYACSTFGFAAEKLFISKIDSSLNISEAIPTSVEIIGVLHKDASIIDCGPPSTLEETI